MYPKGHNVTKKGSSKMRKNTDPYLKLKAIRAENQITAKDLAARIGMAESTYRRKENRYKGADFYANEMCKIGQVFNTAPEAIFFANSVSKRIQKAI